MSENSTLESAQGSAKISTIQEKEGRTQHTKIYHHKSSLKKKSDSNFQVEYTAIALTIYKL